MNWTPINNLKIFSEEISLSGFKQFGSLGSSGTINFDKTLKFNMSFKIAENAINSAALVDFDFSHNLGYHSFASLVYQNKKLSFNIRDCHVTSRVIDYSIYDNNWHDLNIIIDEQVLSIYIDNKFIISNKFKDSISPCMIYIGHNDMDVIKISETESTSIYVKDLNISIDNKSLPSIIIEKEIYNDIS